jgi:hypothetical protein
MLKQWKKTASREELEMLRYYLKYLSAASEDEINNGSDTFQQAVINRVKELTRLPEGERMW